MQTWNSATHIDYITYLVNSGDHLRAKWTYRAIYIIRDQKIGQWSKPVSVTVRG